MDDRVRPGIYRHYKEDRLYAVRGIATDATNPQPGELPHPPQVFYQAMYEPFALCFRSIPQFLAEVDDPRCGYKGPRFTFISPLPAREMALDAEASVDV